jgi:hypothetical protein
MLSELKVNIGFSASKGILLNINERKGANSVMEKMAKMLEKMLKNKTAISRNL